MPEVDDLPEALRLARTGERTFLVPAEEGERARDVVFGGELLAQMITASATVNGFSRDVKSIHAIFARAGSYAKDQEVDVDTMHAGRSFGSDTVTFRQGGKVMARGMLLLNADEPDLLRYTTPQMPDVTGPDESPAVGPAGLLFPDSEHRIVGGLDTWDPTLPVQPPVRHIWTRYAGPLSPAADCVPVHQAILAFGTDGWLIGTSMLPYEQYNEAIAHKSISTGVVGHTLHFHERFDARAWLLLSHEVIWTGRGRIHGRCLVWTEDGRLVASYTQDSMVRGFGDGGDHSGEYHRVM